MRILVGAQHLHVGAQEQVAREQPPMPFLKETDVVGAVPGCMQYAEVVGAREHLTTHGGGARCRLTAPCDPLIRALVWGMGEDVEGEGVGQRRDAARPGERRRAGGILMR